MTTNNHPAHGPVSLDRLHQIREILSKASAQSDGGNLGYAMADAVKVIDGAIAAFGAEPVAWKSVFRLTGQPGSDFEKIFENREAMDAVVSLHERGGFNVNVTPLYTAPPSPIVPPEIQPDYEVIKSILPTANPDFYECCVAADMWNACRAAMIQNAEPVTKPYKLPPHVYRELVNSLRDTAVKYHGCQQLREQISETLSSVITHTPHCGNSPVTPDGWVMVPKEINCAMDDAAWEAYHETRCMSDIWAALLAAAPQQEVKGG
ncbi:hypothetical protein [Citrobacter europaeus]|uniref:hypothetical protein n=1 Tax=Citrobacter europaeus TaxID=1914243 RepID=UPI0039C1FDF4